ncbi:MAG: HD domain-containing protein [Oscillospiraceae bacterium]|jgi:uncharacterized protein
MASTQDVMMKMIDYDAGDPKRIQHFIKVYQFAKLIAELEHVDEKTQGIIEVSALVHDIGIHASEQKYHSSAGNYQELEGPPIAQALLKELGYPDAVIGRVCWLVGHHHTYNNIQDMDHQILVEADFLVNAYEDGLTVSAISDVSSKIFKTPSGKQLLQTMYLQKA